MTDIFMHIHKTGGTTVLNLLDNHYHESDTYLIDGRRFRRSANELIITAKQPNMRPLKLVKGHQLFGLHEHLPGETRYFTMLREPISRIVSLYNYLRQIDLFPVLNNKKLTIVEFIENKVAFAADNGMVRFVSGCDQDTHPYGEVDEKCLQKAIDNIENHFCFVGMMESFNLSLLAYKKILGWESNPYYRVSNKTKREFNRQDFTQDEYDFLKDYLKYDLQLYSYIKDNFMAKIEEVLGPNFKELEAQFEQDLIKNQNG